MTTTDPHESIRSVLAAHLTHTVIVGGPLDRPRERIVTRESFQGDNAGWNYAGFAVLCDTCGVSLSRQWS